jgi:hypothetical protein
MVNENSRKFQPKIIFWITSIISVLIGSGFVFLPKIVFESMGFSTNSDGLTMVRYMGIFMIGLGIMYFLVRNIELSKAREAIQINFAFAHIFGGILLILYAAISNTSLLTVVIFWLVVGMHFTFSPFHIYFIIRDWKEVRAIGKEEV